MEFFSSITFRKTDPPLSRSMVRTIGRPFTTSDAAARRELGYAGLKSRAAAWRFITNSRYGSYLMYLLQSPGWLHAPEKVGSRWLWRLP